jgi:6-pyruvoyltetrahydropterin/6-carboxytetrahydropterin synthase
MVQTILLSRDLATSDFFSDLPAAYHPGVAMYSVILRTDFIAQHFLIGGDWGPENERNSHHYVLELQLDGPALDERGYLVDIVDVEGALDAVRASYADQLLNDLPEFGGLNPSLEHFARIVCERLAAVLVAPNLSGIRVRLWENERASAVYDQAFDRGPSES